ncbi:glutaredoxin [Deinococcus aerius]|uniref:Glutaredoxin n=2 Tax=Deinococcus TaxID=1298 RepID=A0A2I9CSY6_9DEIO|nr:MULTISPECIES: glutaredoxin family protein [Deinococcus]MBB5293729.1 glutaredoxin [Deinococcus metallilatus]QBY07307.1 glutaredoxin family protein [Deinococcus metallilatus]RXJ14780.1 glutaredoxin family protein [Deinococcus metallilatus]TLK30900.1 glutaredoxin family protein [Deinococcus metallilatus]GBF04824.1 glutaredoxin [Deinococcus aerius]
MPEITLYTVPNCADCHAVKRLLTHHGAAFTEKNVRGDPEAVAEMQAKANVRIAPVTLIGEQAFYGPFDDQRPRILTALQGSRE